MFPLSACSMHVSPSPRWTARSRPKTPLQTPDRAVRLPNSTALRFRPRAYWWVSRHPFASLTGENCATRYDAHRDAATPDDFFHLHPGGCPSGGGDRLCVAKDIARGVRFGHCTNPGLGCAEGTRAVFAIAGASRRASPSDVRAFNRSPSTAAGPRPLFVSRRDAYGRTPVAEGGVVGCGGARLADCAQLARAGYVGSAGISPGGAESHTRAPAAAPAAAPDAPTTPLRGMTRQKARVTAGDLTLGPDERAPSES